MQTFKLYTKYTRNVLYTKYTFIKNTHLAVLYVYALDTHYVQNTHYTQKIQSLHTQTQCKIRTQQIHTAHLYNTHTTQ